MTGEEVLHDFQSRVNKIVVACLDTYDPTRHAKEKSIRDAIWGSCRFYAWEVAIIDSPLLQRLRDVRQTGIAYLVYPTAVHSRFDHTLGVVTVASRIVKSINDKHLPPKQHDPMINTADHMRTRLSALLHDVGHSCLSHVSETIYGESEEFRLLIQHVNKTWCVTPKPHEIMSWLVVRSEAFQALMEKLRTDNIASAPDFTPDDMDDIAGNIIGYRKNPKQKFLADIINGPMDADKLDYLVRDAYFAGPTVVYDLDRFLHTVDAIEYPRASAFGGGKTVRLSVPMEGVTALEQLIISKLMLFSYLYHHHKIRCVEGMYHELLKTCRERSTENKKNTKKGKENARKGKLPVLDHPAVFLSLSDRSLEPDAWPPQVKGDKVAGQIISMLARRDLYKRALIISRLFLPDIDTVDDVKFGFERLLACGRNRADRDALRLRIFEQAKKLMESKPYKDKTKELHRRFSVRDVLVDVPMSPTVEETVAVMIPVSSEGAAQEEKYVPLGEVFPIEKWVDAYNAIKWRGHVFACEEAVRFVNKAARDILSAPPYYLRFTNQATDLCKIPDALPPGLF